MPEILLLEDFTDPDTGITTPAGQTMHFHPSSPVYRQMVASQSAEKIIALPESVPGYTHLRKAGIDSIQALLGMDNLTAINGIGPATADEINDFLKKRNINKTKGE